MKLISAITAMSDLPFTGQVLLPLLQEYERPFDKISELVEKGYLVRLRRDLYIAGPEVQSVVPEPFTIANHLFGPSYVTAESALSYYGLIPERVYHVVSATSLRRRVIRTILGDFVYHLMPLPYYSLGLSSENIGKRQNVMIASPEKALCDLIISSKGVLLRSTRQTRQYLFDDLRISMDSLARLNISAINEWLEFCPKEHSIGMLVKTLNEL